MLSQLWRNPIIHTSTVLLLLNCIENIVCYLFCFFPKVIVSLFAYLSYYTGCLKSTLTPWYILNGLRYYTSSTKPIIILVIVVWGMKILPFRFKEPNFKKTLRSQSFNILSRSKLPIVIHIQGWRFLTRMLLSSRVTHTLWVIFHKKIPVVAPHPRYFYWAILNQKL